MAETSVSKEVREFIFEHITSMEQLEVLLLLSSQPDREWTAEAVLMEIQSSQASVNRRLREFCDKGLLAHPGDLVFKYAPKTEPMADAIRALAVAYKERRTKIIDLIYRKAMDDVQSFADAFKLRKDKPDA